jgi:hypothetical protein
VGFFTDEELDSLRIRHMILHVVGGRSFTAVAARKVQHEAFFISKIVGTAVDPVFNFDVSSSTRDRLEKIATGKQTFERGAQGVALSFNQKHVSASSDGALFMFELTVRDSAVRIYSLIKYDYREALQQDPSQPDGVLLRIIDAFIDDNRAIQKAALIRVVNGVAETTVSARDRVKRATPDISDYFRQFLGVTRSICDEELSRTVLDLVQKTLQAFKSELPGQNLSGALASARGVLGNRAIIDGPAIVEAVLHGAGEPSDAKLRKKIVDATEGRIRKARIDQLAFQPVRAILRQPPTRRIITAEGVVVSFPDSATGSTVQILDNGAQGQRIIIDTQKITDDALLAHRAR